MRKYSKNEIDAAVSASAMRVTEALLLLLSSGSIKEGYEGFAFSLIDIEDILLDHISDEDSEALSVQVTELIKKRLSGTGKIEAYEKERKKLWN